MERESWEWNFDKEPVENAGNEEAAKAAAESTGEKRAEGNAEEGGRSDRVRKFRKKAVVVEAMRWNGRDDETGIQAAVRFCQPLPHAPDDPHIKTGLGFTPPDGKLYIPTLEGTMCASPGDWIIKGVNGEFYPCKPDIFEKTYQPEETPALTAMGAAFNERFEPETMGGRPIEEVTDGEMREMILRILVADTRLRISTLPREALIAMIAALSIGVDVKL